MINEVMRAARQAGAIITGAHEMEIHDKEGHANYVTNVDVEVQNFLKKKLLELLPDSVFIGEEQENQKLDDRPSWIVDPIDGTMNFCRGRELSAVSIALLKERTPVLACIYQPYSGEMFTAEKNKGAFLNGQPIHVSEVEFEHAVVGLGTAPYRADLAEKGMKLALEFLKRTDDLRRCGSAAMDLAWVACGRQDIFFELSLSPWDVAAGALIVEEAGGAFMMPCCDAVQFERPAAVLATNRKCQDKALKLFREQIC